MCILFFRVADKNCNPNSYRFVLASNRDESVCRPARQAHIWKEHPHIIAGQDSQEGVSGGTWLGMTDSGKIGVLLNIMGTKHDPTRHGRGFLIVDYLNSNLSGTEYMQEVSNNGNDYNKYNLVTIDLKGKNGPEVSYYNNISTEEPQVLPSGTHSFGNSHIMKPFKKVTEGKKRFEEILNKHPTTETKDKLIEELVQLLRCEERFLPDDQLESQNANYPNDYEAFSAVYVKMPSFRYGSRTHTLILVDNEDNVEFIEVTMEEPIDIHNPKWLTTNHKFNIQNT